MYNLVGEPNNLVEDLDNNRAQTLKQPVDAAKGGPFTPLEESSSATATSQLNGCHPGTSHGYLKFIKTAQHQEVQILQFLCNIQSSMNHTISGAKFWPVQGGTVISMPVAGGHLMSLDQPDDHCWSAASQLVEGVAFMHAQLVAHMDLKPDNIIILLRVVI
ncbi:hypothetical protein BKA82DRAFT_4020242 [Pisolithus tinctorius]|nr:hypothetical protein BKA82DRAFT_4020242 [Pisolithus tinctorius]